MFNGTPLKTIPFEIKYKNYTTLIDYINKVGKSNKVSTVNFSIGKVDHRNSKPFIDIPMTMVLENIFNKYPAFN